MSDSIQKVIDEAVECGRIIERYENPQMRPLSEENFRTYNRARQEIVRLSALAAQQPQPNPGTTHWDGCWRDHLACAVARIEAQQPQQGAPDADFVAVCQRLDLDPTVDDLRSLWNFAQRAVQPQQEYVTDRVKESARLFVEHGACIGTSNPGQWANVLYDFIHALAAAPSERSRRRSRNAD